MNPCPYCGVLTIPGSYVCGNCGQQLPPPQGYGAPAYAQPPPGQWPATGPEAPPPPYAQPGYPPYGGPPPPGPASPSQSSWGRGKVLTSAIVALVAAILAFLTLEFPWYAILAGAGSTYFSWSQVCSSSSCVALSSVAQAPYPELTTLFEVVGVLGLLGGLVALLAAIFGFLGYGSAERLKTFSNVAMVLAVVGLVLLVLCVVILPLGWYSAVSSASSHGQCSVAVPFSYCTENTTTPGSTQSITSLPYISWFLALVGMFLMIETVLSLHTARKAL